MTPRTFFWKCSRYMSIHTNINCVVYLFVYWQHSWKIIYLPSNTSIHGSRILNDKLKNLPWIAKYAQRLTQNWLFFISKLGNDKRMPIVKSKYVQLISLPDFTFVYRIHARAFGTVEIKWEIAQVAEWTNYAECIRRMHACGDFVFIVIWPGHRAPCLCRRYPEHLRRCVLQSGQFEFGAVAFNPFLISYIRLFDATIVGNVFALRVDAVHLEQQQQQQKAEY